MRSLNAKVTLSRQRHSHIQFPHFMKKGKSNSALIVVRIGNPSKERKRLHYSDWGNDLLYRIVSTVWLLAHTHTRMSSVTTENPCREENLYDETYCVLALSLVRRTSQCSLSIFTSCSICVCHF